LQNCSFVTDRRDNRPALPKMETIPNLTFPTQILH
jgi:hypothetical protein